MPHKPHISDYEPVTRSRPSASPRDEQSPKEVSSVFGSAKADSFVQARNRFADDDQAIASEPAKPVSHGQRLVQPAVGSVYARPDRSEPHARTATVNLPAPNEEWSFKRGHSLSFAGLFLFTVVLYFRPYEFSSALSWLSSSAFVLATATLLVFIPTQLGLEGRITARPREVNLVLLLLAAALLSIPMALSHATAWGAFTEYLKVVIMFIVMVNVVRTEQRLRAMLLLVLAASCFLSVGAIYDYRIGKLASEGGRINGVIGGLFGNPNDLALHLVTIVPIAVGLLFAARNPLTKITYLGCSLLLIGGIIATFSRGGFLGVACAIFVLTWKLAPRGRLAFAVLGLMGILIIVGLAPGAFRSRIATTGDESAIARTDDLIRSIKAAVYHPLLGLGMSNYVLYSNRAKATHNAYTQVAAELGLAAAACYLLFVIAPLKPLRRIEREHLEAKQKPAMYYLAIAFQASIVGYMVSSFFSSAAFAWYIYYLVGYAVCLRRVYEMNRRPQPN